MSDLYASTNLAVVPDISTVGRAYYTLAYELDLTVHVPEALVPSCPPTPTTPHDDHHRHRTVLRLSGINYRARAYLDGIEQHPIPDGGTTTTTTTTTEGDYDGMFHRRAYDITCGKRFHIIIEPPLHPGTCHPVNAQNNNNSSSWCRGQGGNHALAADGATAQYMLGWDWAQAMPDRATGFWGAVHVETYTSGTTITLQDVALQTLSLKYHLYNPKNPPVRPSSSSPEHDEVGQTTTNISAVTLRLLLRFEHLGKYDDNKKRQEETAKLVLKADWGETWIFENVDISKRHYDSILSVHQPEQVRLWWPHGIYGPGQQEDHPHLHTFTLTLYTNGNNPKVLDETIINVGIRTVETFLDETIQGQTFRINGEKIYLVGGNWIGELLFR